MRLVHCGAALQCVNVWLSSKLVLLAPREHRAPRSRLSTTDANPLRNKPSTFF